MEKLKIDGERLRASITERKESLASASTEIGYSTAYLSWIIRQGYMPKRVYTALNDRYGIEYQDIMPIELPPDNIKSGEQPDENKTLNEFLRDINGVKFEVDYEKLNSAVFTAVYGALVKASREGIL